MDVCVKKIVLPSHTFYVSKKKYNPRIHVKTGALNEFFREYFAPSDT
jgi:hypothetical protein